MQARSILFGRPDRIEPPAANTGLLILRVFAGLALALAHGLGKIPPAEGFVGMLGGLGVPAPEIAAWMSGIAEFFGGILLALGLLTRPAAFLIVVNFIVALTTAHAGDSFGDMEKPLLFMAIAVFYLLAGPGRYSVDAALADRGKRR